jgi:hypothetical protein
VRADTALDMARDSVKNFFDTYEKVRQARNAGQGAPMDNEQDLLRAALVFAAAGLDSTLKELIKGSVRTLSKIDTTVQEQFETFVQRKLRGDSEEPGPVSGNKFLASILASALPQERLLNEYVLYLTGSSLQSVDQLFKSASALGADTKLIADNKTELTKIFAARNRIIHELDVKFTGKVGHRQRNRPKKSEIERQCKLLLDVAAAIIGSVRKNMFCVTN